MRTRWFVLTFVGLVVSGFVGSFPGRQNASASVADQETGLDDGLVLHYTFDEDDGTNVWDSSGQGNDGYVVGAVEYGDSLEGLGPRFTSKDTYIRCDAAGINVNGWTGITYSAWFFLESHTKYNSLMGNSIPGVGHGGWRVQLGSADVIGQLYVSMSDDPANRAEVQIYDGGSDVPPIGEWVHVAGVFDGSHLYAYLDGELRGVAPSPAPESPLSDPVDSAFIIGQAGGGRINWTDDYLPGFVDEVRIYNKALSSNEVRVLYESQRPRLDDDLVAHYRFDGDASDATGNGHDGTAYGITWTDEAVLEQAACFDGDDSAVVEHSADLNPNGEDYSVVLWFKNGKTLDTEEDMNVLLEKGVESVHEVEFMLRGGFYNGAFFRYRIGGDVQNLIPAENHLDMVNDGRWHQLAAVVDENGSPEGRMYLDGQLVGTREEFTHVMTPPQDLTIGKTPSRFFEGCMDEIRIYRRALSSTDVATLYENEKPEPPSPPDGLVLHYTFDEDDGTNVWDSSGQGNHGYLVGGVAYGGGVAGHAARIDRHDEYVRSDAAGLNTTGWTGLTVSAWVQLKGYTYYNNFIWRDVLVEDHHTAYHIQFGGIRDGGLWRNCSFFSGPEEGYGLITYADRFFDTTEYPQLNRWYHFVGTFDTQESRFYIDGKLEGVEAAETPGSALTELPGTVLSIGKALGHRTDWLDAYLDGLVDEVRIYNRALYSNEVTELHGEFAATNLVALTVAGAPEEVGAPGPQGYGTQGYDAGAEIVNEVASPAPAGAGARYVCQGWTGDGSVPAAGDSNRVSFVLEEDSTLTWQWAPEYQLTVSAAGGGSVVPAGGWYADGAVATVHAEADEGYAFAGWQGDVPSADADSNPLELLMDAPRSVTARFQATNGVGLVAYYPFDEDMGGVALDMSGAGRTANVVGATWVVGDVAGGAMSFDGRNDYLWADPAGLPSGPAPAATVSLWIKPSDTGSGDLVWWGTNWRRNRQFGLQYDGGETAPHNLALRFYENDLTAGTGSLNGEWHHVAATYDGVVRKIYLDGMQVAEDETEALDITSLAKFQIGYQTACYAGLMDEIRIYDVALSSDEIAALHGDPGGDWKAYASHASATHLYFPGENVIDCSFRIPDGETLLSLTWSPVLPEAWRLVGVAGDGAPEILGDEVVFGGGLDESPIRFAIRVAVPAGETGERVVRAMAEYQFQGMSNPAGTPAYPHRLVLHDAAVGMHSADYRAVRWVIDAQEMSRVLAYWRAGGYGPDAAGFDGYAALPAPYAGPPTGLHAADYLPLPWQINVLEANRVLAYWRAGGYRIDPTGLDGYAAAVGVPAALDDDTTGTTAAEALATGLRVTAGGAETYDPGGTVAVTTVVEFASGLLALCIQPEAPAGWELVSVEAPGVHECNNNAILWTGALPESPLTAVMTWRAPVTCRGAKSIGGIVDAYVAGDANADDTALPAEALEMDATDADADGLPDAWEAAYSTNGLDPEADGDLDGLKNAEEWIAGTDPTDDRSVLKLGPAAAGAGGVTIEWQSAVDRRYTVLMGSNVNAITTVVASGVTATPPTNRLDAPVPVPVRGFFRVEVEE